MTDAKSKALELYPKILPPLDLGNEGYNDRKEAEQNAYIKGREEERATADVRIAELEKQLTEKNKQVENWKHAAKSGGILLQNWEAENQRLTAEVKEWKGKFNECDNAFRNHR